MWAQATLFSQSVDANVYSTGSVKIWKTFHKISVDIPIFLQCRKSKGVVNDKSEKSTEEDAVDAEIGEWQVA